VDILRFVAVLLLHDKDQQ